MKCDNHCSNEANYRIHRKGQEPGKTWYDRFVTEAENIQLTEEDKSMPYDQDRVARRIEEEILAAVRRAAGLE